MTTSTLTITAFLLARIAEDEAVAREAAEVPNSEGGSWWVDGPALKSGKHWVYATGEKFEHRSVAAHIARHDPARVLAECKAKRAIVERSTGSVAHAGQDIERQWTVRALASIYADHSDYNPAWS